jgi:hypothetical protein
MKFLKNSLGQCTHESFCGSFLELRSFSRSFFGWCTYGNIYGNFLGQCTSGSFYGGFLELCPQ